MNWAKRYSAEFRERAVRIVPRQTGDYASQWEVIQSIAAKVGCTDETIRGWLRQAERDLGRRPGLSSSERDQRKELGLESWELKRAMEILRKASAFFAQAEFDRRPK